MAYHVSETVLTTNKADITIFTFQMRKLRLSEVKYLAQVNWKTEHNSESL